MLNSKAEIENSKDKLIFSNFKIKKSYVHCIKNEIKKFHKIDQLLLDGNKFGDEGVKIIC